MTVLVDLGAGHASEAGAGELDRLITASGLHDACLLGPQGAVLGSDGSWLSAAAVRHLIDGVRVGGARRWDPCTAPTTEIST